MNKKNLILSGVLLTLIALAFIYSGPLKKWQAASSRDKNFLANIDVDKITKIEVKKGGETTTLEKQGERLKIIGTKDFYVDETSTVAIKTVLTEAKQGNLEIVSKNKDKKSDFLVNDDLGVFLNLYQDNELVLDLIIGKATNDYSGTYISRADLNKTYSINAKLNSVFDRADWYDYKIFADNKEAINKIRFQYPTREFTIEKNSETGEWQGILPYVFTVSAEKIDPILSSMANLRAVEIPEQNFEKSGLDKHSIIIQATGTGIDNTLMLGSDNGDSLFYAKRGDSDNLYLITQETHDELDKQIWDLK